MFSPEASIQSARSSLRNPRRRQRTSEGLPSQPRRKRSKLNEESFVAKEDPHINGNGSVLMNGHAGHSSVENSLVLVDMPVREKKAPPKRASKEDNALYLVSQCHTLPDDFMPILTSVQTKNANYTVKKLPCFPSALLRPSSKLLLNTPRWNFFLLTNISSSIPRISPTLCRARARPDCRPRPCLGLSCCQRTDQGCLLVATVQPQNHRSSPHRRHRS